RGPLNAAQLFSKGDAHPTSDGVVQKQELLGRVMRIYRDGRRIDLAAPRQLALGLFISQLSLHSRFWYPLAKFAATVTRPVRRVMNAHRISTAAATRQGDDGVIALAKQASRADEFLQRPDGKKAFDEDLEEFYKTAVLLYGNDQPVVFLAEMLLHELGGFPIH